MTEATVIDRHEELLNVALGPELLGYLNDTDIIEIMVNPGGTVVVESLTIGKHFTGQRLDSARISNVIKIIASFQGITADEEQPEVAGILPGRHARFQGWLPPVAAQPVFVIRKHTRRQFGLDDYLVAGLINTAQLGILRAAITQRRNLLIAGGTSSGKTTLAAALLKELENTQERVFILEDVPELRVAIPDQVILRTSGQVSMRDLVRGCLRMRPDRIIMGEVRDGAALDLLKAWNTGHPGGLSTIHANNAEAVIPRLQDLISEVVPVVPASLIQHAVDLIVQLDNARHKRGRIARVAELKSGEGQSYTLEEIA